MNYLIKPNILTLAKTIFEILFFLKFKVKNLAINGEAGMEKIPIFCCLWQKIVTGSRKG